ncbi:GLYCOSYLTRANSFERASE [Salix purpurea]|uniref:GLYCOSYLTRANSFERASE n=1 Tax=Salix purpurea TaxID=77065 RepID=A0A9Q0PQH1_SALPP|nr:GLYCOSYLTRANSFERASE [Salix purpurea]
MGSLGHQVHIFFFPFLAHGHMIPSVDMAKLFASRGVKTTIITTPLNAPFFSKTIQKTKDLGFDIDIQTIKFPAAEAGLPEGCENTEAVLTNEMTKKFIVATTLLQEPFEKVLQEIHPDCIVADMFFPWATDAAAKFGIPRLVFHGTSNFALCAGECVRLYEPHKKVSSDFEPFVVPSLPGDIKLTRKQLPGYVREDVEDDFTKLLKTSKESELRSFGVVVNSFYELEPAYADHHRKVLGRRAWNVGPVSVCNRDIEDKSGRGKEASIDQHECLKWLDSKKLNSVVYICFGSMASFAASQLKEMATGLEASGQQFIWVVRRNKNGKEDMEDWLPEGFEERMEGKGTDYKRVGTPGKPMITWPLFAEQFYNEKLVTDVLRTGVAVGVKEWVGVHGDHVTLKSEAIEKAVTRIMVGVEADEKRSRARELGETARKAVEKGGSSFSDFNALIEELSRHRP